MSARTTFLIQTLLISLLLNLVFCYLDDDLQEERMHPSFREKTFSAEHLPYSKGEHTNDYWLNLGKEFVRQQKQQKQNTNVAKNLILFVGDGMGLTTLVAARNYIGGENTKLSFEEFPYVGLSKTYSVDKMVSDSAATSTALLCGIKANFFTAGVNGAISRGDCEGMKNTNNYVHSIAKWAMDKGKSAGFVTNTRLTHATATALYAHKSFRFWETNTDVEFFCGTNSSLNDSALQLIHGAVGSKFKVMMGGGKSVFIDSDLYSNGWRTDRRNLIQEYQNQSALNVFVETKEQLEKVDLKKTKRLLGIFSDSSMDYRLEAKANPQNTQPSLEEMTKKAIKFLQQQSGDKGYFLLVEGGRIQTAHDANKAHLALDETKEFSKAVNKARHITSEKNTLIVVTADHSSAFTVAGYQDRGSSIFSFAKEAKDKKPYEPLSYANGPGYYQHYNAQTNKRVNPKQVLQGDANDLFPATVPSSFSTNGGEDVPVFALGPWSHLFTGVYEQNAIPHMMAYAACIGDGLKACDVLPNKEKIH